MLAAKEERGRGREGRYLRLSGLGVHRALRRRKFRLTSALYRRWDLARDYRRLVCPRWDLVRREEGLAVLRTRRRILFKGRLFISNNSR